MAKKLTYEEMADKLRASNSILHVCHASADLDAAGSAYGSQRAFGGQIHLGKAPKIFATNLYEYLGVKTIDEPIFSDFETIVVYDTPDECLLPSPFVDEWFLIDHHPKSSAIKKCSAYLLRNQQSCCQVVDKLIQKAGVSFDAQLAIAIAAGILGDTRYLRIAKPQTLHRFAALLGLAKLDLGELKRIIDGPATREKATEFAEVFKSFQQWDCNGMLIGMAQTNTHAAAFEMANTMIGKGFDLLLAVISNKAGDSCLRFLEVSDNLRQKISVSRLIKDIASDVKSPSCWGGGVHCPFSRQALTEYLHSSLGRLLR